MKMKLLSLGLFAFCLLPAVKSDAQPGGTWYNQASPGQAGPSMFPASDYLGRNFFLANNSAAALAAIGATNAPVVSFPTNTAPLTSVTNDFVAGGWNLLRNQRAEVMVSVYAGTASSCGIIYSNAVTGQTKIIYASTLATTTNQLSFVGQPNSQFAVTNCTILPNTSEIDYE
jgi:hypothetical protein